MKGIIGRMAAVANLCSEIFQDVPNGFLAIRPGEVALNDNLFVEMFPEKSKVSVTTTFTEMYEYSIVINGVKFYCYSGKDDIYAS